MLRIVAVSSTTSALKLRRSAAGAAAFVTLSTTGAASVGAVAALRSTGSAPTPG